MRRGIMQCQEVLRAITGRAPRWFRAVVGHANPFVSAPLRDCGLARVAWDARAFDAVRSDPPAVVARLERELAPGAIVLLHEGARHGRNVERSDEPTSDLPSLIRIPYAVSSLHTHTT